MRDTDVVEVYMRYLFAILVVLIVACIASAQSCPTCPGGGLPSFQYQAPQMQSYGCNGGGYSYQAPPQFYYPPAGVQEYLSPQYYSPPQFYFQPPPQTYYVYPQIPYQRRGFDLQLHVNRGGNYYRR